MDINQLTLDSINRYHQVLKRTGFIGDQEVYKLFILSFLDDLFKEDFSWYITEEDYELIDNLITCLSKNSCIIPYTKVASHTEPIKNFLEDIPTRVSENNVIRLAEVDVLRLVNQ